MNPFLALFLGASAGVSGLVPFLHVNSVLPFLAGLFSGPELAVFVAAFAASRLAFEVLPAVFFAVPSDSQGVSVLPAHRMALAGEGVAAASNMLSSAGLAIIFSFFLVPFYGAIMPFVYSVLSPWLGWAVAGLVLIFFVGERSVYRAALGLVAFVFAGVLGFLVLNGLKEPLFPLLVGLFGVPALFLSVPNGFSAEWREPRLKLPAPLPVALGVVLGFVSGLFPAVSPAVIAGIAFLFLASSRETFLSLASAVAASKLFFDFAAVFFIGRARSAAAVAVQVSAPESAAFMWVLAAAFLASFFAACVLVWLCARRVVAVLSRLSGPLFNGVVLGALVLALYLSGGGPAVFAAAVAACIGLSISISGLRPAYGTGALLVPTLLYYFGLSTAALSLVF